jgi:SET domain
MAIIVIFCNCFLIVLELSRWRAEGFQVSFLPLQKNANHYALRINNSKHQRCHDVKTKSTSTNQLENIAHDAAISLKSCLNEVTKVCKVKIAPVGSASHRLGLVATESISKSEVALAIPFDDRYELNGQTKLFQNYLPSSYNSWTGEVGIIALLILNEVALSGDDINAGISVVSRSSSIQEFMKSWVKALPGPAELKDNPILWSEDDQEVLQSSTTNKIYKLLDDIEEDALWLVQNIFEKDRSRFPETVTLNGEIRPCFNVDGYKWAMALSRARSFFLDGTLRLIPFLDMCNHSDEAIEVRDGYMGTFGTIKGAQLVAAQNCNVGDEVFCSYGPKSAADYLLEYGFCPDQCWNAAVSEISSMTTN